MSCHQISVIVTTTQSPSEAKSSQWYVSLGSPEGAPRKLPGNLPGPELGYSQ